MAFPSESQRGPRSFWCRLLALGLVAEHCRGPAAALPRSFPRVWLAKDLRRALLREKHPWLFDRALRGKADVEPGAVVAVMWKKEPLGLGLYDPSSPLRVRLLTWGAREVPDDDWVSAVVASAARKRRQDADLRDCSGIRLLHGENDWTPGLTLDAYGDIAVVAFDGKACEAFWLSRLEVVLAAVTEAGFSLRSVVRRGSGGVLMWGEPLAPEASAFREHGALFEVDVRHGHKTGFFLDQRENRKRLRELSSGKDVLDLFSYTGGFALSAAIGGARSTTSVDSAAPAVSASRRNFALNGLEAVIEERGRSRPGESKSTESLRPLRLRHPHRLCVADCWDFLKEARRHGELFDIVVCDPPSMAPNAATRKRALAAYKELNAGALALLRPGGLLISCSCSSHVTSRDLRQVLLESAQRSQRPVHVEAQTRAASDHPLRPGFPEGDYLQAFFVRAVQ